jgi:hypothetical protein
METAHGIKHYSPNPDADILQWTESKLSGKMLKQKLKLASTGSGAASNTGQQHGEERKEWKVWKTWIWHL